MGMVVEVRGDFGDVCDFERVRKEISLEWQSLVDLGRHQFGRQDVLHQEHHPLMEERLGWGGSSAPDCARETVESGIVA